MELDRRLPDVLAETLANCSNVQVVPGDVLQMDLQALFADQFAGCDRLQVCANLPYYITTPVLMRLLESELPIERLVVMVQLEAAKRLCAPLGTRDCGAVSAAVEYYTQAEILFEVGRESFYPQPQCRLCGDRLDPTAAASGAGDGRGLLFPCGQGRLFAAAQDPGQQFERRPGRAQGRTDGAVPIFRTERHRAGRAADHVSNGSPG